MISIKNISHLLFTIFAIVAILFYGQNILIPFVFALLFWFIVKQIRVFMERITFIKTKIPIWLKNLAATIILLFSLNTLLKIVLHNVTLLSHSYQKYQSNTSTIIQKISAELNPEIIERINDFLTHFNIAQTVLNIFNYSTNILGNLFLVIIYALFIFLEEPTFKTKISLLLPNKIKQKNLQYVFEEIEKSISKYLGLKTFVSVLTGLFSWLALLFLGVDFPIFWAFLIFLLNYIPTIGSLIATVFPSIFSCLQYGELLPGLWVLLLVGSIQFIVGNLLEPKLMGNSINLSPLIIILSLSFWGSIWGITGMLLSVPIMAIIVIILSKFPKTKPIAILLSANGIPEK
ncbi:MAG: AI-2E family transporter [Bacteroidota bacterium]|nr:AI-2E family transporter [Bacteroidota bacterium]